jgi:hypothetical protein
MDVIAMNHVKSGGGARHVEDGNGQINPLLARDSSPASEQIPLNDHIKHEYSTIK